MKESILALKEKIANQVKDRLLAEQEKINKDEDEFHRGLRRGLELAWKIIKSG